MWVAGIQLQQTSLELAGLVIEVLSELMSVDKVALDGSSRKRMIVWLLIHALMALSVTSLGAVCELSLL